MPLAVPHFMLISLNCARTQERNDEEEDERMAVGEREREKQYPLPPPPPPPPTTPVRNFRRGRGILLSRGRDSATKW